MVGPANEGPGADLGHPIPAHFHFIWFGASFPDFAAFAVQSALAHHEGASVSIWHDGRLTDDSLSGWAQDAVNLRAIEPDVLFERLGAQAPELDAQRLATIYSGLTQPAARANVVRMLVLYLEGGIYLDTDTLTVRSLDSLRRLGAFCGEEPTLWPAGTALLDPRAIALGELRRACSMIPFGYRFHRRMTRFYTMAANNAVVGAAARHPFLLSMLQGGAELPREEWGRRFRLGTHLLQRTLQSYVPASEEQAAQMVVLPTPAFYPLGPEISRHYFKRYAKPAAVAQELLSDETYVIHWYGSVADLKKRDRQHVRAARNHTVYGHLCAPYWGTPRVH